MLRPQGDSKPESTDGKLHCYPDHPGESTHEHARSDTGSPPGARLVAQVDPVEAALADALHRAARAEQWDVVQLVTDELRARRDARASTSNVVRLPVGGRS
jgi:hypothetical protein